MFWTDTKRIIKAGWTSFWRNSIVSFASVLVVTITLSVIASLLFLQAILHHSLDEIKNKVDITIYFKLDASEDQVLNLKSAIEKLPEVVSVGYVSAPKALADFKEKHKDDYLTLQALEELEVNPLGAYVTVKAQEATQYESIAKALSQDSTLIKSSGDIIDKINYNQNKMIIDRLISIIDGAKKLGFIITLILVIFSLMITFNTIRLTIFIAREEIGIMRLVGAGSYYVRGPFVVQGMIYGVISSLITLIAFLPLTYWLGSNMTNFLSLNIFDYYLSNFFQIFAIVTLSGILLGMISSFLAVSKYLNK